MSDIISNLGSWINGVMGWLFGSGSGSTATPGIFDTILDKPELVALLIGVPLVTLLIGIITKLIKRSVRR